jgi:hypothetical protein
MRARGNIAARLDQGKRPRQRDVRALERIAQTAGNAALPPFARRPARRSLAEVGNVVIDSWYFLVPFGLLCSWLFVCIATAVSP